MQTFHFLISLLVENCLRALDFIVKHRPLWSATIELQRSHFRHLAIKQRPHLTRLVQLLKHLQSIHIVHIDFCADDFVFHFFKICTNIRFILFAVKTRFQPNWIAFVCLHNWCGQSSPFGSSLVSSSSFSLALLLFCPNLPSENWTKAFAGQFRFKWMHYCTVVTSGRRVPKTVGHHFSRPLAAFATSMNQVAAIHCCLALRSCSDQRPRRRRYQAEFSRWTTSTPDWQSRLCKSICDHLQSISARLNHT